MMARRRSVRAVAVLATALAVLAVLAGCSGGSTSESPAGTAASRQASGTSSPALTGTVTVLAAASLKVTFDRLRTEFKAAHPAVTFPPISYNGSSILAVQIRNGAPADVFASADEAVMDSVADLVTDRHDFATNTLRIAVPPGNPKHITSLADLAKPGVLTVVCAPRVPCGAASHKALDAAGVALKPASEEQNVTAVLTKVETGDADAGLVYATDVNTADGKVDGIAFPQASAAVNTYPIAVLKDSASQAAARAFVAMVTGPQGRKVLGSVGFGTP